MKRIILTGGGTAGHVTPNIALIESLRSRGFDIHYIGSNDGIEKSLIKDLDLPYHPIATGKLRRYISMKNLTDPFKVIKGCYQATKLIKSLRPDLVFSKGGFVSVPVIIGAKLNSVPSIIHESDITPGLANKISIPFATRVCTTFVETLQYLPKNKAILTGTPIRTELLEGNPSLGRCTCNFHTDLPILMMVGGSLGAKGLNDHLRQLPPKLLKKYQVVHLCGSGNLDPSLEGLLGYKQFDYVKDELAHLFAMTDLVISRAGANAISEILALKKPNILIPLPKAVSRGDQLLNAESFKTHGYSYVIQEESLKGDLLLDAIDQVYKNRNTYIKTMNASKSGNGIQNIIREIEKIAH